MTLDSLFGILGTILGLVRATPQLLRLLRSHEAYGVSVDTALTSAIVSSGWVVYAVFTHQPFVILATAPTAVIFVAIAIFALRYGRCVKEIKIAPIWLVVLIAAALLTGKDGLGILLPVSVLVANLPQLWVAYRESNLADLSLGTWLMCLTDGLIWGAYALIRGDIPILFYAIFQLSTSGPIVALKWARRAPISSPDKAI